MATVVKTIGSSGRDYSTMTAWEAAINNTTYPSAGTTAQGECYNDSTFDESVTIDAVASNVTGIVLTAAAGQRHTGTAGTGARIVASVVGGRGININAVPSGGILLACLELDENQKTCSGLVGIGQNAGGSNPAVANQLIVHGMNGVATSHTGIRWWGGGGRAVMNSLIYGLVNTWGSFGNTQFGLLNDGSRLLAYNVTVHDVRVSSPTATGHAKGIVTQDVASAAVKNCLTTNCTTAGSGTGKGFDDTAYTTGVASNNASSDATASGSGSLTNLVTADQYVSTVVGSEDLHLKANSACINAGTDLGTTPAGVQFDIDGRDRDAEGDVWDIGADEYVTTAFPSTIELSTLALVI